VTGSGPVPADREGPPPDIDISVAHVARVYDYWLGGKTNFTQDQVAARAAMRAAPHVAEGVRGNRAFLARAVRYLVGEAGVRQFLDIGTGIPAADNTHEVAQAMAREWPFFQTLLSNMDMVLAKSDIGIASRYKDLVEDAQLREAIFARLCAEWESSKQALLSILDQRALLERNPVLARTIRDRFPYIDPLNHVQLELLKRHRAGDTDERVVQAIHLTINGIAAGLRNSG